MSRQCSKTGCAGPALATLTYVYRESTAVLGPLATYAEPHTYDLCSRHAEGLTAPRGWEVVRLSGEYAPPPPTTDDLLALANAVRHSGSQKIEVEIGYAAGHLRVLVRDNGSGIDEHVLRSGREGHWGLSGMRERAEQIGARLRVWSRPAAGTEIELVVPGQVAFQSGSRDSAPSGPEIDT